MHRGFGLAIDPKGGLTAADINTTLRRLLDEPGFAAAARKLQQRLRARPRTPAQEAAGARLRLPSCWHLPFQGCHRRLLTSSFCVLPACFCLP